MILAKRRKEVDEVEADKVTVSLDKDTFGDASRSDDESVEAEECAEAAGGGEMGEKVTASSSSSTEKRAPRVHFSPRPRHLLEPVLSCSKEKNFVSGLL